MVALFTTIHILSALILILVVLLQSGKSADLAGAFGGGGSQTAFGPRGAATLLSKITTVSAIVFMVTSFSLAVLASKRSLNSVLEGSRTAPVQQQSIPASTPGASPAASQPQSTSTMPASTGSTAKESKGGATSAPTNQKQGSSTPEKKR